MRSKFNTFKVKLGGFVKTFSAFNLVIMKYEVTYRSSVFYKLSGLDYKINLSLQDKTDFIQWDYCRVLHCQKIFQGQFKINADG